MIPYMSIPMRIIAWLLWRFNGWSDPDECSFECVEHPDLARSASVCRDYWYVKKAKKEGAR